MILDIAAAPNQISSLEILISSKKIENTDGEQKKYHWLLVFTGLNTKKDMIMFLLNVGMMTQEFLQVSI